MNRIPRRPHRRTAVVTAAVLLIAAIALRTWILEPVSVASNSMEPTLLPGTIVLIFKPAPVIAGVRTDDLVVFPSPLDGTTMIKRVIAEAGQTVEIKDARLYVDSVPVIEPFVDYKSIDGIYHPRSTIPAGHIFVLGDNRAESIDSRHFGPLPVNAITGTVLRTAED